MIGDPCSTWAVTRACPEQGRRGNPLWEEILEMVQRTSPDFILNVTLNAKHEITGVFAGELAAAHRVGTDFVRETAMQPVPAPFDVVITSNSGYPLDLNLYQAVKGMSAAAQIVRPGGDIIVAAECWDGLPDHGEYARLLREADSPEALLATITAPGFRCQDQWEAQIQAQIQQKARVHVYADGLTDAELREAMVIPCESIEATVAQIREATPDATIAVLPEGPQTVPYLET
jgi:nickel-dependent lactate racemase